MITGIIIENFKGIREREEIELRPLTLLFGENSAGKSTIIEALFVLEELLLDRHHRRGKSLTRHIAQSIGSVRELVHGQDPGRSITLGVTVSLGEGDNIFGFLPINTVKFTGDSGLAAAQMPSLFLMNIGEEEPTSLTVTVTFCEDPTLSTLLISQVMIAVNGHRLVCLKSTDESPCLTLLTARQLNAFYWEVDTNHEILSIDAQRAEVPPFRVLMQQILPSDFDPPLNDEVCSLNDGPLALSLNIIVLATLRRIESELACHRRIGPMRMVPPRHFRPQPQPSREDWLTGIAAWDQLGFVTDPTLDSINEWLGPDKLDTGIAVVNQTLVTLSEVMESVKLDPRDRSNLTLYKNTGNVPREILLRPIGTKYGGAADSIPNLLPSQVGSGISQIVPVVVACVSREGLLVTIAQPELHLHPRLQVKLGDLFIDFVSEHDYNDKRNQLIVETHSEHLILRLLRRVRETTKRCVPEGLGLASEDIVVYHVSQEQGRTVIRKLDIDANGQFVQPWPDDFFEIDFYERFDDAR